MSDSIKIAHLTSVHPRFDVRIFTKMCSSLASQGYDVSLVVADGLGNENRNDIQIIDAGRKSGGRLVRMTLTSYSVYKKALKLEAGIYHLHDPELIPAGLFLKFKGKKVIFDMHEDLPLQLRTKPYWCAPVRWMLSKFATFFLYLFCPEFDAIVTSTPFIRDKFRDVNRNVVDVNNFPISGEFETGQSDWSKRQNRVCYVGVLSAIRGIKEMVNAMSLIKNGTRLAVGGTFSEIDFEREVRSGPGWSFVDYPGLLSRQAVKELFRDSISGIVIFLPLPNHINSQPNKLFEYMSAGIPVIASDFPLWRRIVEENNCGICVDPKIPQEIADAIDFLVSHPEEAGVMGENGRKAVISKYNWSLEEKKLLDLYARLSNN